MHLFGEPVFDLLSFIVGAAALIIAAWQFVGWYKDRKKDKDKDKNILQAHDSANDYLKEMKEDIREASKATKDIHKILSDGTEVLQQSFNKLGEINGDASLSEEKRISENDKYLAKITDVVSKLAQAEGLDKIQKFIAKDDSILLSNIASFPEATQSIILKMVDIKKGCVSDYNSFVTHLKGTTEAYNSLKYTGGPGLKKLGEQYNDAINDMNKLTSGMGDLASCYDTIDQIIQ